MNSGKGIVIVFLYLFTLPKLDAQKQEASFQGGISLGPAFPMGKFSSTISDSGNISSSSARAGLAIQINMCYFFRHSDWGISFVAGWQENSINPGPTEQMMRRAFPNIDHINIQADAWNLWKFLAGPEWKIPASANSKIRFECGIGAGILKTSIPGISMSFYNDAQTFHGYEKIQPVSLPAAFCYQVHAGILYGVSPKLFLTGDLNFSHAAPERKYSFYLDPPVNSMPVKFEETYPISSMNLLLGVAYKF